MCTAANHFHEKALIVKGRRGDPADPSPPRSPFASLPSALLVGSGNEPGACWSSFLGGAAISLSVSGSRRPSG